LFFYLSLQKYYIKILIMNEKLKKIKDKYTKLNEELITQHVAEISELIKNDELEYKKGDFITSKK